jgi:hypothetical protein
MSTNYHHIDYQYVYFTFDWNWIKDKQIVHKGNETGGGLFILDSEGNLVKGYGYERIA